MTYTFYTHDRVKNTYPRLATVESEGLANHVGRLLAQMYPLLYIYQGSGKKTIHGREHGWLTKLKNVRA